MRESNARNRKIKIAVASSPFSGQRLTTGYSSFQPAAGRRYLFPYVLRGSPTEPRSFTTLLRSPEPRPSDWPEVLGDIRVLLSFF